MLPATRSERCIVSLEEGDRVLRLTLASPPSNAIDAAMVDQIRKAVASAWSNSSLRTVIFDHDGPDFSSGTSDGMPADGSYESLVTSFHELLRELVDLNVPLLAAVNGRVLGTGLELVSICNRIFAAPEAQLGQPEVRQGRIAPAGSALLPLKIGQAAAEELLLRGSSIAGDEAKTIRLVDHLAHDPAQAALDYARAHYLQQSPSSLRYAVRAARSAWRRAFFSSLDETQSLASLKALESAAGG